MDLLFPPLCFGCKTEGAFLCARCKTDLRWIPPTCFVCGAFRPPRKRVPAGRTCSLCQKKTHIYAFLSPFSYAQDLVREQLHSFKYNRVRSLDAIFAQLLREYLDIYNINLPKNEVIIPIPLHKSRERTRGFNQSERIARRLQEIFPIEFRSDILQKIKPTKPQIELTASERRQNVIGTFAVNHPEVIKNKTVILLDDVKTTGATLEEAARVLKDAGAKKIWAITIAH
ncbi:MAG: hypothetical protein A3C07_00495 [Candidatus Sungbacteria bacterium RIFCSPHIGHO2_02_FULL_47_11]|uniref:Phosphoribosyltransferase domain-containing protein n=1 Tax=Candidatus Sungbacteria bacterium RIFCSPHIGHO2_02_FULL_47_11 TaxID=1802270 RepID=A0A1G2KMQ0_9BACT|nr:MAG: hypothetical protein A3C07_00495 [Candidatus Sungbacteria bacterium RIFCSPHIGHO2_02_FULL_47_11]